MMSRFPFDGGMSAPLDIDALSPAELKSLVLKLFEEAVFQARKKRKASGQVSPRAVCPARSRRPGLQLRVSSDLGTS